MHGSCNVLCPERFEHTQCNFLFLLVAYRSVSDLCRHHHAQLSAGASLIQAEDGPRLSAFLAEWDESRRKSSIRSAQVSNINTEIWNTVRQTARLTVASYEGSMSPTYTKKFPAYQWDDRYEGSQADRYMPYILQIIKVDSRQWQWVDVQGQRNLLTQVSMHTLGYNFKGTTDIILCSRNAVRSHIYTSGMRVLLEVKKAPVHDDSYQAMVILLLANSLNPKFKPVVVLTDLRDSWVFFWLEGQCIWHSAQDRPAAAGILEDMLEHEELENSEVETLPKEDCDRLGIYKRRIFDPNADGHKDQQDTSLADTIDSLSAEEAAITKVQYMLDLFKQIPGVPMPERMGPRPVCPILGMYM